MHAIHHNVIVNVKPIMAYNAIVLPIGLNSWWTQEAEGYPEPDNQYRFFFTEEYAWHAKVTSIEESKLIEWTMTNSDADWDGTILRFELIPTEGGTKIRFSHTQWKADNDHFRRTSYYWALYLRLLKRFLELEEIVPFGHRSEV